MKFLEFANFWKFANFWQFADLGKFANFWKVANFWKFADFWGDGGGVEIKTEGHVNFEIVIVHPCYNRQDDSHSVHHSAFFHLAMSTMSYSLSVGA